METSPQITHAILSDYVARGLVRRQETEYFRPGGEKGKLFIFSYTQECQYSRAWDWVTMQCRGLVLNDQDEVLARPFTKFFNLGEPECPPLPDLSYQVFDKLDGSLLIAFWDGSDWRLATRGSFENQYTEYGYKCFRNSASYSLRPYWLGGFPISWTLLFEIVPPPDVDGMARVVRHKPGPYLLGAVETRTGRDINPVEAAAHWDFLSAECRAGFTLKDCIARAEEDEGTEGWVVRYSNGFRVKIKTAWYLKLFRAINDLTEKNIRAMLADTETGLVSTGSIIKQFPEEFRPEAEAIVEAVVDGVNARHAQLLKDFEEAKKVGPGRCRECRKAFAMHIKDNPDKGYLFMLLDGKPVLRQLILDEGRVYYAAGNTDAVGASRIHHL